MTPKETTALLAYFASAWPNAAISDAQTELWLEQLQHVDAGDGRAAAKTLVGRSKWFPSIAEFLETTAAARRARQHRTPALSEPRPPLAERQAAARTGINQARAALTKETQP